MRNSKDARKIYIKHSEIRIETKNFRKGALLQKDIRWKRGGRERYIDQGKLKQGRNNNMVQMKDRTDVRVETGVYCRPKKS